MQSAPSPGRLFAEYDPAALASYGVSPDQLIAAIREGVEHTLPGVQVPVQVRRSRRQGQGDWSTTVALHAACATGSDPQDLAAAIAEQLRAHPGVAHVEVAGAGFLNISLTPAAAGELAREILEQGERYGLPPELPLSRVADEAPRWTQLVQAVGVDAARYALARCDGQPSTDLDADLLVTHNANNPGYRVRYAHARACSIMRRAGQLGVRRHDEQGRALFDPALLSHATETVLLAALADFPYVTGQAAAHRQPSRLTGYLEELAGHFTTWDTQCHLTPPGSRPVSDTHRARLWLLQATRQVLANGLQLLGVHAPSRL